MKINNLHLVWFSASATTKRIISIIAEQFTAQSVIKHDITKNTLNDDIHIDSNDLLIVGAPVFAGRIPAIAVDALNKFKGNKTPAVMICVYGNRDYDDAMLELKNILQTNDFSIISTGAFIAQHSIFPAVGASRPDEKDMEIITAFGKKSAALISSLDNTNNLQNINVKGNYPYKKPGKIPLTPKADKICNKCGTCVKLCPTNAIPALNPRITFGSKCIACTRCIAVCPQHARHFGGLLYKFAGKKFTKDNSARKEPEILYASLI